MQSVIRPPEPSHYADHLERPITAEELLAALKKGAKNKASGIYGICLEFYTENWEPIWPDLLELLNQMFLHKKITPTKNMRS
jgi:hypothetical protein